MTNIANGEYLTEGECCPVRYSYSPVDEFGYQEIVCHSDSDETVVVKPAPSHMPMEYKVLHYMGYPAEECYTYQDEVYTLDGDCYLGNINTIYQPQSSYLSEAEYEATKHLMEF